MTAKIFRSIFIPVILAFVLTLSMSIAFFYGSYGDEVRRELVREAELIGSGIENYGEDFLKKMERTDVRVTLIEANGRVVFDTRVEDSAISGVENHLDREEISEALESGEGYAARYSATFSETSVYYAVRLNDGRVLRISSVQKSAAAMLLEFLSPILLLLLGAVLLAILAARRLSVSIVRPINELDLEAPERAEVYDELKPVIKKLSSQNRRILRQMDELRMKENEFTSITENMSEGMIVINSRTAVLSSNASARRILSSGSEMPKSVLSLGFGDSLRAAIVDALAGKTGYDSITLGEKHYSVIVTPVSHDDIVEGAVIMLIDDTEKERREALRREFTSNISHELKTPLTSISGFAELISCGMADGEQARHFADNIMRESERLIALVGDIIRLTQLDGGEIPYDEVDVELLEVASSVTERLDNVASAAGVSLSVTGEPAYLRGSWRIVEEIVYNLTDNGIKYNRHGGRVVISVSTSPDGSATLTVSDNGIGIPEDMQDRVFERFYRVDKSHSRNIGGTGLGLSIVKHAVAYHKGQISLSSEEGVGTEITVKFPPRKTDKI